MDIKDIVKALRVHLDQNLVCDDCPLKDLPLCFTWLINETISVLERQADNGEEI